eukprot:gene47720-58460_t
MPHATPDLSFGDLTPEFMLDALEAAGLRADGRMLQLNSFENRVLMLHLEDGGAAVAKFYRPLRWSDAQILEEHAFATELAAAEAQFGGYTRNGGFAEYALADADYVGQLPKDIAFVDIAPILCAGVTVYKGLKVTDTKPGDWVVISGIGGLGHMAVQYAKAMGLNVVAVDIADDKLDLARRLGASLTVNAKHQDPTAVIKKEIGGAHGVLVTAVSPKAFEQALGMVRRGGTIALNGLPPGSFP